MAAWLDFSPLFIGEPRAAADVGLGGVPADTFQSPLHRGATRGRRLPGGGRASRSVSVPSSSGSRARQRAIATFRAQDMFQSPLHRGAARGAN